MCVDDSGGSLANEELAVALDDEGNEAAFGRGCTFAEVGQLVWEIFLLRDANFLHGAGGAIRGTRCADERAEFHEGLVEV